MDIVTLIPLSPEVVWTRYLEHTQELSGDEYRLGEEVAWDELQEALLNLQRPAALIAG
jgi:hypothetical protein